MGWSELFSVIQGRYHYIESPNPELYDLLEDPRETENLAAREPRVAARMAEELDDYGRDLEAPEPLSEEKLPWKGIYFQTPTQSVKLLVPGILSV